MSFTQEECEIYLKPSTELIPDEYQQEDNGKACVHIFIFKENMEKKFVDCMKCLEYNITENNVHPLSTRAEVISSLNKICLEIKEASSLIILFWGLLRADKKFLLKDGSSIKFMEIWSTFISSNCSALRGKPKIFIFNGFPTGYANQIAIKHSESMEEDAVSLKFSEAFSYNIPAEADVLIVFKHNQDLKSSFEYMDSLCSNFENYAQREDISSLLTIAHFSCQPTLISTMTKKFYLKPCAQRGIQLSIREKYFRIKEELKIMRENIIYLTKNQKKNSTPRSENSDVKQMEDEKEKAISIEENLHRRVSKSENMKIRPRSNTTSTLIEYEKILHRRRGSADHRPAWRY